MTENAQPTQVADDEIDLRELFSALWKGKWIIAGISLIFAITAIIYALSLPNIYKSEALLAPAAEQKSNISGQLGGLAALAGISLGGGSNVDKTALAIEIIKSRDFLGRFIEKHIELQDLIAVKSWDMKNNKIFYDKKIFDSETKQWLREAEPPKLKEPSKQEAIKAFLEIFSISQDKSTGMIKLSIEHISPFIAKEWVQFLINELNQEMKTRDITEAEKSIAYLERQIKETNVAVLRNALFSLIEEQTKTLMLANVRDEYVFKIVDPAIVPEDKAKPSRALIVILFTILGGMFSVIIVLTLNLVRKD